MFVVLSNLCSTFLMIHLPTINRQAFQAFHVLRYQTQAHATNCPIGEYVYALNEKQKYHSGGTAPKPNRKIAEEIDVECQR
jgi:hypothetical protein